jgi:hypothetical protein
MKRNIFDLLKRAISNLISLQLFEYKILDFCMYSVLLFFLLVRLLAFLYDPYQYPLF